MVSRLGIGEFDTGSCAIKRRFGAIGTVITVFAVLLPQQITRIRKTVCAMANQLRKAGYSLKDAFKKAWQREKLSMTVRTAGTTFENRIKASEYRLAIWSNEDTLYYNGLKKAR